ncbi:SDR family oxidoreductase [Actinoplanes sp. NPDC049596]|uniref:SDR family oxidoreductase n=1 Tax=unclassified Actinoplanes TaxID=2626549 RepID=UPI003432B013
MRKPVSDQVVVITGASSGIGRATALAFAARGARVVCAARTTQALDSLVEQITAAGGTAVAVPTDVADPEAVTALAKAAEQRFGRIDTWVNNAAVGIWGRVEDISGPEFERVMRVNFLGQLYGIKAALPALRRAGGGTVIGVVSAEGVRSVPLQAPYTASKFAVRALHDSLRSELAQEGAPITVTTILPASINTPFFEHARSKLGSMAKPPPPVYAPELVADTIVYAAEHPRREISVGGAAAAFGLAQRLAPALTDAVLGVRRLGRGTQQTPRPDTRTDNVDTPAGDPGRLHGAHPGLVLKHSPYTTWLGRRRRPGELLLPPSLAADRPTPRRLVTAAVARTAWAGTLLLAARTVLRPPAPRGAPTAARILAARHLLQAATTAARPTPAITATGLLIDTLHATTDLAAATLAPSWRRIALIDATATAALAALTRHLHRR